jgi:peptidoglycan/xylan/chitin deacetylase (PgdA/CDA1 family)
VVFAWHNVAPTWFAPTPRRKTLRGLGRQLQALAAAFHVVPLAEGLERLLDGRPLPARAAALTFDDGYRDNLGLTAPLLERLGLPATFFLVPTLLDGGRAWWETVAWAVARGPRRELDWGGERRSLVTLRQRAATVDVVCERLKLVDHAQRLRAIDELIDLLEPRGTCDAGLFLDWDAARRLARRPGAEIGSHSRDHAILSRESAPAQLADLTYARRALERGLNVPVPALAYPNGETTDYDERTIAAARAAGHRWALTGRTGVNRPDTPSYELYRAQLLPGQGVPGLLRPWPLYRGREHRRVKPAAPAPGCAAASEVV